MCCVQVVIVMASKRHGGPAGEDVYGGETSQPKMKKFKKQPSSEQQQKQQKKKSSDEPARDFISEKESKTLDENSTKVSKVGTRFLQKAGRAWGLGSGDSNIRIGVSGPTVFARLSNVHDLTEKRPKRPKLYRSCHGNDASDYDADDEMDLVSNTIFLNLQEIKGLSHKLHWYVRVHTDKTVRGFSDSDNLVKLTKAEKEDFQRYPYLVDARTSISIERRELVIEKYDIVYGDNQMDQNPITTGKVSLSFEEVSDLEKVIDDVYTFMSNLEKAHSALGELIRGEIGKCLSKMLRSEFGPFTDKMIYTHNSSFVQAFHRVHGEFLGYGYYSSLSKKVLDVAKRQKLDVGRVNTMSLMFQVMCQVDTLFSTEYLKCPK
jgi:hypothetical protein